MFIYLINEKKDKNQSKQKKIYDTKTPKKDMIGYFTYKF